MNTQTLEHWREILQALDLYLCGRSVRYCCRSSRPAQVSDLGHENQLLSQLSIAICCYIKWKVTTPTLEIMFLPPFLCSLPASSRSRSLTQGNRLEPARSRRYQRISGSHLGDVWSIQNWYCSLPVSIKLYRQPTELDGDHFMIDVVISPSVACVTHFREEAECSEDYACCNTQ